MCFDWVTFRFRERGRGRILGRVRVKISPATAFTLAHRGGEGVQCPGRAKRGVPGVFTLAGTGSQRRTRSAAITRSIRGARVGGSLIGGPCQLS